jgi:N-acetylneuraminic acid mutarotase
MNHADGSSDGASADAAVEVSSTPEDAAAVDAATDAPAEVAFDVADGDADDVDASDDAADAADAAEPCVPTPGPGSWRATSTVGAPKVFGHTAVWTGTELLVWGGSIFGENGSIAVGTGARYDPVADTWTPMSAVGAPEPRHGHAAVWLPVTQEMMVLGGFEVEAGVDRGGLYRPATNSWRPLPATNAPSGRLEPVLVSTGRVAILWCGRVNDVPLSGDGAVFDPVANQWHTITTSGAPPCTGAALAAWTGRELLVWGGNGAVRVAGELQGGQPTRAGGLYDPFSDKWRPLGPGAPMGRWSAGTAFGDGVFIATGGLVSPNDDIVEEGLRYDVATGTWRTLTADEPLFAESGAWLSGGPLCGGAAAFWGGLQHGRGGGGSYGNRGKLYLPGSDLWQQMSDVDAPSPRTSASVVSTGGSLIVFGGYAGAEAFNTGGVFTP